MYAFFRVKLQSQSMVQNLDPKLALKKKLEHRAKQNHEHHWFGRAWPAQCGWQEVARPARAAGPKYPRAVRELEGKRILLLGRMFGEQRQGKVRETRRVRMN